MSYKTANKNTGYDVIVAVLCLTIAVITIYPMWYVLILSISNPNAVARGEVWILPKGFYFDSYKIIFDDFRMWRGLRNSVFYTVTGTVLMLITSSLAAYPLTRPNLKGRTAVVIFLLIPMYISGGLIPTFLVISKLGLYNTVWALIIPGCYGIWNIILCRTFFMTISQELWESASIDGANNYQIFLQIYIPLSKPVLAVIAIYTVVAIWNSWFASMVYQPNEVLHPVQMYLQRVLISQTLKLDAMKDLPLDQETRKWLLRKALTAKQLKYSIIIFVTLPIIMVYPMFQKHFVKGVMLGSLKG